MLYRIVIIAVFVFVAALALVSFAEGTPILSLAIAPDQLLASDVGPGTVNVSAGKFRLSASSDSDIPDVRVTFRSRPEFAEAFKNALVIKLIWQGNIIASSALIGVPEVSLGLGAIPAGTSREFETLLDIGLHAQIDEVIQIGIAGIEDVVIPESQVAVQAVFPLWGTPLRIAPVAIPTPPPRPTEQVVWLEDVLLRTNQGKASAGLRIAVSGVISVEMAVDPKQLAPIIDVRLNPSFADWSLAQTVDTKGVLRIAAAGATPVPESDQPVLWLVFDTSQMLPGDWFSFLPAISWNEGPWTNIVGRITFLPVAGDITVDGEITAFDAVRVLQYSVGLVDETDYPGLIPAVADVSGNGIITGYDAGLIFQFVAGLINIFPVQAKDYGLPAVPTAGTTAQVAGKVVASEPAKVRLGETTTDEHGQFIVPVVVDHMNGVLAGQLEIGPVGDGVSIEPTKLLEGYQVVTNQRDGKLLVSFAGVSSPEEGGEMLRLRFTSRPVRLTVRVQFNENPAQVLSTAVEQTSWGRIKATFAR